MCDRRWSEYKNKKIRTWGFGAAENDADASTQTDNEDEAGKFWKIIRLQIFSRYYHMEAISREYKDDGFSKAEN